jgi:predicted DNA-binding protein
MKRLTFSMPDSVYEKFQATATSEGTFMADVLREMIASYCDDVGA